MSEKFLKEMYINLIPFRCLRVGDKFMYPSSHPRNLRLETRVFTIEKTTQEDIDYWVNKCNHSYNGYTHNMSFINKDGLKELTYDYMGFYEMIFVDNKTYKELSKQIKQYIKKNNIL